MKADEPKRYRAICFDLDGTLLGMDIDEFMTGYFSRLASWAANHGLDAAKFIDALKGGTKAMALSDDDRLNKEVFWEEFYKTYGRDNLMDIDVEDMAARFYEEDFTHIGDGHVADPVASKIVETLSRKGYPLLLTTMPMFPLKAVEHRLSWAGVSPSLFARITHYENSKTTKPRQTYFAENLAAMGLEGKDVLMVGNNTMEDLAFLDLGADGYLVTDWLLDPVNYDIDAIKHGSLSDFLEWADHLDDCEDPATDIATGPIPFEDMERAYRNNISPVSRAGNAEENSRRLADAIETDVPLGKEGR